MPILALLVALVIVIPYCAAIILEGRSRHALARRIRDGRARAVNLEADLDRLRARLEAQPRCRHCSAIPVTSVLGDVVAHLCPACDRQLPATWSLTGGEPAGPDPVVGMLSTFEATSQAFIPLLREITQREAT